MYEFYDDETLRFVVEQEPTKLIAVGKFYINIIDRKKRQIINKIEYLEQMEYWKCAQRIIGYDSKEFPYMILKD